MLQRFFIICFAFTLALIPAKSQVVNPVKWSFSVEKVSSATYNLKFKAKLDAHYHLYNQNIPDGGPVPTSFKFNESSNYSRIGKVLELSKGRTIYDSTFSMKLTLFSDEAIFAQKIKVNKPNAFVVNGKLEFMSCDDKHCLPPKEEDFTFNIPATPASEILEKIESKAVKSDDPSGNLDTVKPSNISTATGTENNSDIKTDSAALKAVKSEVTKQNTKNDDSLWGFFLVALLAGFAGALTPCVYPMIPMTVSFFLRGTNNRFKAISKGLFFGVSIISIYMLVALLGGSAISNIATHWLSNFLFFALFVVFALSFFGMFEIVLPGSLANKVDQQADKGGYIGIFFMALALVVVSFSCTLPFVGSILIEGASVNFTKSLIGMLGYSLAFALPYTVFAISPALLKSLPKSGGWLNVVKVVMGLFMLAFSFKFLSNAAQSLHWTFITREVVLSVWIAILFILGLYLLGKIKLPHDSDTQSTSVGRFIFAIASFSMAVYFVLGIITRNDFENFASILPPPSENVAFASAIAPPQSQLCGVPAYSDFLKFPYGLKGYFDYDEGLACARQLNKPILLDFKGHSCANCKVMEASVWSNPEVLKRLSQDFVVIGLYADENTALPENKWKTSKMDGKIKKTIGHLNSDLEIELFQTNTLPYYAIINSQGKQLTVKPMGFSTNVDDFIKFLDEGKVNYRK